MVNARRGCILRQVWQSDSRSPEAETNSAEANMVVADIRRAAAGAGVMMTFRYIAIFNMPPFGERYKRIIHARGYDDAMRQAKDTAWMHGWSVLIVEPTP